MIEGYILVDKPVSWTSFDVVNYLRRLVALKENKKPKNVKVGHCGTLDPFASGLLIILIGKNYTKKAEMLTKLDKSYEVSVVLGKISTTGDNDGEVTNNSNRVPTELEIRSALAEFTGVIKQIPPMYSAIKIDGVRSYELARKGKKVEHKPREVTIYDIEAVKYDYPKLNFTVKVSSGTYIRTLVEDIGSELKIGAYTEDLRRTSIDKYRIDSATAVKSINESNIEEYIKKELTLS